MPTHAETLPATAADALRVWVLANPTTVTTAAELAAVPPSLLAELYPHLNAYGPRGDIYVTQVAAIVTLLDRIDWNLDGAENFVNAFETVGAAIEEDFYGLGLNKLAFPMAARRHYPNHDFLFIMEPDDPDDSPENPLYAISNHQVWSTNDNVMDFLYALEQFTVVSLYEPLLTQCLVDHPDGDIADGITGLLLTYAAFCEHWGIPV